MVRQWKVHESLVFRLFEDFDEKSTALISYDQMTLFFFVLILYLYFRNNIVIFGNKWLGGWIKYYLGEN